MAALIGISERMLRHWQSRRIIPYEKINRIVLFNPEKVLAALEKFERNPEAVAK
jgi:DNA-binding transcriptional MerR regulator